MTFKDLLKKNRSYRRFDRDTPVPPEVLRELVEYVRYTASPANLQPLKFAIVSDPEVSARLFELLKWAAYLRDWSGPTEGERPTAYVVILGNPTVSSHAGWDYGIAMQTILLGAADKGFGGCAIASCDKNAIRQLLDIPEPLEIAAVIALGKPVETVVIDDMEDDDVKYWRDDQQVHHVPKRKVEELILKIF